MQRGQQVQWAAQSRNVTKSKLIILSEAECQKLQDYFVSNNSFSFQNSSQVYCDVQENQHVLFNVEPSLKKDTV